MQRKHYFLFWNSATFSKVKVLNVFIAMESILKLENYDFQENFGKLTFSCRKHAVCAVFYVALRTG